MKRNIVEHAENAAQDLEALEYRITVESTQRFLDDDRVWPVEVWMALRDGCGKVRLRLLQLRPDPTEPAPGEHPLVRRWSDRVVTNMNRAHRTVRECPEEIISRCAIETDTEKMLAVFWEIDHGRPQGYLTSRETTM